MYQKYDRFFEGLERDNPHYYIRIGRIIEVINSLDNISEDPESESILGKVKLSWLDWGGRSEYIPISYPSFSNPILDTDKKDILKGSTQTGVACGIFHMPSIGDIAVCAFRQNAIPVIIGYLPANFKKQTTLTTRNTQSGWGNIRLLNSGEYNIKSKQQAEVYLDRKGSIQLRVKEQPISETVSPTDDLCNITIGNVWDEDFETQVKSSFDKNIQVKVNCSNGANIVIDTDGNIEINSTTGKEIKINSGTLNLDSTSSTTIDGSEVNINSGTKGVAREDDSVKSTSTEDSTFWAWFTSTLVTYINTHTHTGVTTGAGVSGPPSPPISSAPSSLTGKITASSSTVKAGD